MANFRTRARAVDLLGKSQIRDEITAFSELLRNAYDADASYGLIDVDSEKDRIIVRDDGDGMSMHEIDSKWLTLGTYSKKKKKIEPSRKGRIKVGEKGIGRLAISILGDQLVLVSKKRRMGSYLHEEWSLLYLHWGLFNNPQMFLEDIEIPTYSFSSVDELIHSLRSKLLSIKQTLLDNLSGDGIWEDVDRERITEEIESFHISAELEFHINKLRNQESGTLFYVTNLEKEWDWNLYKETSALDKGRKNQEIKNRMIRMNDLLYSFHNYVNLYEDNIFGDSEESKEDFSFKPDIIINESKISNEELLNIDDVKLFDYGLIGKIEDGFFTGTAIIKDLDGPKSTPIQVQVNQGMESKYYKDSGPIDIRWYFLEGESVKSCLTNDEHEMMLGKLRRVGGIYVLRDGIRILPYGEPSNDFLGVEERRTYNARNLFSFRRMFGYMGISKITNPRLLDKSSREGFVENSYYLHFRQVAVNLLMWWARDFLESFDPNKSGLRHQRIKDLANEKDRRKRDEEQKKFEKKQEEEYFKTLNKEIESFGDRFEDEKESIRSTLEKSIDSKVIWSKIKFDRGLLREEIFRLKQKGQVTVSKLDHIAITINKRYTHSDDLIDIADSINIEIQVTKKLIFEEFDKKVNELRSDFEAKIIDFEKKRAKEMDKQELIDSLTDRIDVANRFIDIRVKSEISQVIERKVSSISNGFNYLANQISSKLKNEYRILADQIMFSVLSDFGTISQSLVELKEKIYLCTTIEEVISVAPELDLLMERFEELVEMLQSKLVEQEERIEESGNSQEMSELLVDLKRRIETGGNNLVDNSLIGILKKEVTMYRELSAVGLAAELTSHEFNNLYGSIKEDLEVLQKGLKGSPAMPYLEKTERAFLALEKLHQRMSPLYRRTRARRKNIKVRDFVTGLIEYFKSDLERHDIKTVIDIPKDAMIKESETVLFTPMVNIVSNSIYWILNQEIKEIHFYMSDDYRNLYIHDTGMGIREKDSDRLFEPYFSRKVDGRGLGLYLSRDILETKGHSLIYVKPEETLRDLRGACFSVQFEKNTLMG